jgi:hypothetical protein
MRRGTGIGGAAAMGLLAAGAAACTPAPGNTTVAFDEPGAHEWVVPDGVHWVSVDALGAGGGTGGVAEAVGGVGARVQTAVAVEPGTTITIVVGGRGGDAVGRSGEAVPPAGAGGIGGGAPGGVGAADLIGPPESGVTIFGGPSGGGGGGASDVRTGPATAEGLASRLVVAGGGGGGGSVAGGAGDLVGQDGGDGIIRTFFANEEIEEPIPVPGGGGGTATTGGTARPNASPGALGVGGAGGAAPASRIDVVAGRPAIIQNGQGGGGGGGGAYGGGGGPEASSGGVGLHRSDGTSGAGGGGSSYATPDALCAPIAGPDGPTGDGSVTLTFRVGADAPDCPEA